MQIRLSQIQRSRKVEVPVITRSDHFLKNSEMNASLKMNALSSSSHTSQPLLLEICMGLYGSHPHLFAYFQPLLLDGPFPVDH